MLGQRLPSDGAVPRHDVQRAGWHTRFVAQLRKLQHRDRRELRRLDDDGVPGGKGGSDLLDRDQLDDNTSVRGTTPCYCCCVLR